MLHCMGIQPIRVERLHSRFRRINGLRGGDSPDLPWHPEIAKVAIAEMEAVLFESGLEGGQSASSVRSRNISIFPNRCRRFDPPPDDRCVSGSDPVGTGGLH